VQAGVSPGTGVVLLETHEGSVKKAKNACFIADLFVAALYTAEYSELGPSNKIVIVTDNSPDYSGVEDLARGILDADGIMNGSMCNRAIIMLGHKAYTCALYEEALELCKSL
jgi:hypothetical protein